MVFQFFVKRRQIVQRFRQIVQISMAVPSESRGVRRDAPSAGQIRPSARGVDLSSNASFQGIVRDELVTLKLPKHRCWASPRRPAYQGG